MQDMIKLLPDGASAVAVIVVVMLFLKQQDRINLMLETITKSFSEQVGDSQKTFQEQILRLAQTARIDTLIMCHLSGAVFVRDSGYTPDDTAERIVAAFPAAIEAVGYAPTKLIMNRFPGAPPVDGIVVPVGDAKTVVS